MTSKNQFPLIRIHPVAHEHLLEITDALRKAGRPISMTRMVSDLILTIPMPNGHTPAAPDCPPTEPCSICGDDKVTS